MRKEFALMDQDGNFVAGHSIDYYKDTKRVVYSYSPTLTNGFFNHPTYEYAEIQLNKLFQVNARFQLPKTFHIEEIDGLAVVKSECETRKIFPIPFVHEYFDFDDGKHFVWVIKDSKGHFVHANSIKMYDSKTWMYVSSKTFSSDSRGYDNHNGAACAKDRLYSKCIKMKLNEVFSLEYLNLDDLIKQHKEFTGENLVIIEKLVA